MLAELVSIILRIGLLLGATWGVLYLGATEFDREFVTGIWIVVLFLIAEARVSSPAEVFVDSSEDFWAETRINPKAGRQRRAVGLGTGR